MMGEIQSLLDQYWIWLKDQTQLSEVEDRVEITIPYLDRHNDCFQIYAKRDNGGLLLTDDGYVLLDLEHSGCPINTPSRKSILHATLDGFGITLNEKSLETLVTKENFAVQKHNLIQAMLAVNDLFYLASPTVVKLFRDDLLSWFESSSINYEPDVKLSGKSGFEHRFDFVVPESNENPERLIRTFDHVDRNSVQNMAFSLLDTRETRASRSIGYAVYNDHEEKISDKNRDAMRRYDIQLLAWSDQPKLRDALTN